jgi:hypothetical protein
MFVCSIIQRYALCGGTKGYYKREALFDIFIFYQLQYLHFVVRQRAAVLLAMYSTSSKLTTSLLRLTSAITRTNHLIIGSAYVVVGISSLYLSNFFHYFQYLNASTASTPLASGPHLVVCATSYRPGGVLVTSNCSVPVQQLRSVREA